MKIIGFFCKEIDRDYYNGQTEFFLKNIETEKLVYCVGKLYGINKYIPLELEGEYRSNAFFFTSCKTSNGQIAAAQYLSQINVCKTIKEGLELSNYFNNGLFGAIKQCTTKEEFKTICPADYKKSAYKIYKDSKLFLANEDTTEFIIKNGGSYEEAMLLVRNKKHKSLQLIKSNPYVVGRMCSFSFGTCDSIAKAQGYSPLSTGRINSALEYAFDCIKNQGSTCTSFDKLASKAFSILKNNALGEIPMEFVKARLILNDKFVIDNDVVTTAYIAELTKKIISNIKRLNSNPKALKYDAKAIAKAQIACNIELVDSQTKAFELLKTTGIKILQGGPGTGKTTVVNVMLKYINILDPEKKIVLCAPTGSAAQNLAKKTGLSARTIHKTINYTPYGDSLGTVDNLDADVIIADEVSMLDEELFYLLLKACPNNCLILLIGDSDQLPSVNPGNVLNDLKLIENIDTYTLTQTFRQKEGSTIVSNAYKVKNRDTSLELGDDFLIESLNSSKAVEDYAIKYLKNIDDLMCLCPVKKKDAGTIAINQRYSPNSSQKKIKFHDHYYHLNDKVIFTNNNYKLGFFNGEDGVIVGIDSFGIKVKTVNNVYDIDISDMKDLLPAYAITIHKSQGSEYSDVMVLLTKEATRFVNSQMLYTAITRAKENITIISEEDALETVIRKAPTKRDTYLEVKIYNENRSNN